MEIATRALLAVLLPLPSALSRRFEKCEVALQMYAAGYARDSLPAWMCTVNAESSFNSSSVGGPNINGSFDWALY